VRNSGIMDGKFLERKHYKKPDNTNIQPTDLLVGRDIVINGYSFNFMEADEFTVKWFANNVKVAY